ncbi:unnamed protein product [Boreogadus saida]
MSPGSLEVWPSRGPVKVVDVWSGERTKMWKQDGFEEQFNQEDRVPHQHREEVGPGWTGDICPNLATLRTDIRVTVANGCSHRATGCEAPLFTCGAVRLFTVFADRLTVNGKEQGKS